LSIPPIPTNKKEKKRIRVKIIEIIAMVVMFIQKYKLVFVLQLKVGRIFLNQVNITVKPLIKIAKVIIKNGRTSILLLFMDS